MFESFLVNLAFDESLRDPDGVHVVGVSISTSQEEEVLVLQAPLLAHGVVLHHLEQEESALIELRRPFILILMSWIRNQIRQRYTVSHLGHSERPSPTLIKEGEG